MQLGGRRAAGVRVFESVSKNSSHADDGIGGFVDELGAEVADAGVEPAIQMRGGLLRLRAEDGVAAADVGHHGMGAAARIAQLHAMLLARAAAIAVAGAGGKEAAEHAVLGVKHGEVLVDDRLDFVRARCAARARQSARRSDRAWARCGPDRGQSSSRAVMALAAFRLKSPVSGGVRVGAPAFRAVRRSAPGSGNRSLSRKSAMRSSPGFSTRGLAMRASMPEAFTRSSDGRRP